MGPPQIRGGVMPGLGLRGDGRRFADARLDEAARRDGLRLRPREAP